MTVSHFTAPAICGAVVVDHRPGAVLLQISVDLAYQPLAVFLIGRRSNFHSSSGY
jgi:hypothetical protein